MSSVSERAELSSVESCGRGPQGRGPAGSLPAARPVCDYEGSAYRTEFWGRGREYEDAVERVALRALLPPVGGRLLEIGAGFGRLVPLYVGYEQVVLFDYARSQLEQARELWGDCAPGGLPRYLYVMGDFYCLPFSTGLFDTVTMVRTLHHAADAPAVLQGVAEVLAPAGTFVLEFANKRHLKAVLRYLLRRQRWSPFDPQPIEFAPLNFDFHPAWIQARLGEVGLRVVRRRAVSHLRVSLLKQHLPLSVLVGLDRALQPIAAFLPFSPSVFVQCRSAGDRPPAADEAFFRCTVCRGCRLVRNDMRLSCADCGAAFAVQDGIYDFRHAYTGGGG